MGRLRKQKIFMTEFMISVRSDQYINQILKTQCFTMARYMLDDCANVEEAIKKTETGILVPEDWQDCHFTIYKTWL